MKYTHIVSSEFTTTQKEKKGNQNHYDKNYILCQQNVAIHDCQCHVKLFLRSLTFNRMRLIRCLVSKTKMVSNCSFIAHATLSLNTKNTLPHLLRCRCPLLSYSHKTFGIKNKKKASHE